MKKALLAILLIAIVGAFAACRNSETGMAEWRAGEIFTLEIAATARPHAEILEYIRPYLLADGVDINVTVFTDFHIFNPGLADGDLCATFFQHQPFLSSFPRANELYMLGFVHVEPIGAYSLTIDDISELQPGATVAFPNDPANHGRALLLLQQYGVITLDPAAGILATYTSDIMYNPLNLRFHAADAALLPHILTDVDMAVINTNHVLNNYNILGMHPMHDSVIRETAHDNPYANGLTVRVEDRDHPALAVLMQHLQSQRVYDFIWRYFDGAVVPVFRP